MQGCHIAFMRKHQNTVSPYFILCLTCLFTFFKQHKLFCSETPHSLVDVNPYDTNNLLMYSPLKPSSNFLVIYGTCQLTLKYIIESRP